MLEGQVAKVPPERVARDVVHEYRPPVKGRGPARSHLRADREPVDRFVVGVRQSGGASVAEPLLLVQEEDRADRVVRPALDEPHDGLQRLSQIAGSADRLQHVPLRVEQGLGRAAPGDLLGEVRDSLVEHRAPGVALGVEQAPVDPAERILGVPGTEL